MTAAALPVTIVQFTAEAHPRRTEHWSIAVPDTMGHARIYELMDDYGSFLFSSYWAADLSASMMYRGGCLIGHIPADRLDWMEGKLKMVPAIRGDHSGDFNCQTWIMDALEVLKGEGIVDRGVNETRIRTELAVEKERWECAEDTVLERLFQTRDS